MVVVRGKLYGLALGLVMCLLPMTGIAQSDVSASIRVGLSYVDDAQSDGDIAIADFGSRIAWSGEQALNNGLTGFAVAEFGLESDDNVANGSGINRTRQLYAGLRGGLGSLTVGAQYGAFYDLISFHTDVAKWGSCWTQFECSRKTRVAKLAGATELLGYAVSFTATPNDIDNDVADEIELGFNYALNGLTIGVASTLLADNGADSGGQLMGFMAKGEFSGMVIGVTHQIADADYSNSQQEETNTTVSLEVGGLYGLFNAGDRGDTNPTYWTLGYKQFMSDSSLLFYEWSSVDSDDGSDAATLARMVYQFDF